MKNTGAKRVRVWGHTDRAGAVTYNDKLAELRTLAVANSIKGAGVSGRKLGLGSFGEHINAIKTGPGVREKRNRRVEILVSY